MTSNGADWSDIVLYRGNAATGNMAFQCNLSLPEIEDPSLASENQKESVRLFYGDVPPNLNASQAHLLLSAREYGRLASQAIFKSYSYQVQNILGRCLAVFVMSKPDMREYVGIWSENNFRRGVGSPRVKGAPIFYDVEQFARYVEGSLLMDGWTVKQMKTANWDVV